MQRLTPLQISPNHEEYITRVLEPIAHASARADATGNAEEDFSVNTSVGTNSDLGGLVYMVENPLRRRKTLGGSSGRTADHVFPNLRQ